MSAFRLFERCGIEIEYSIAARDSLDVLPIADALLQRLASADAPVTRVERGMLGWSNGLALHVAELKSLTPSDDLKVLARRLHDEVVAVNKSLDAFGARLMPGGMHPWMDPARETRLWPHDRAPVYKALDRLFDCRTHGWSNVRGACVSLPFANDEEFARLHAAVRTILPILPALAAASPYADGRATDWMDYRMEAYRRNADAVPEMHGEIVPEPVGGRADYERRILAPLYRAIEPHDPENALRHDWLNGRGAIARFERNAVAVRVLDAQECPQIDVALAALLMDVAEDLCERHFRRVTLENQPPARPLAGLFLACIHDADRARIDDPEYLRLLGLTKSSRDASSVWSEIAERLDRQGSRHSGWWRNALEFNLSRGPLARRLLRAVGPRPDRAALHELYSALCDALLAGKPFDP
jgi:gamma-glutamyl:cysteine ligase YbdK (ATP-grasp superfamily)